MMIRYHYRQGTWTKPWNPKLGFPNIFCYVYTFINYISELDPSHWFHLSERSPFFKRSIFSPPTIPTPQSGYSFPFCASASRPVWSYRAPSPLFGSTASSLSSSTSPFPRCPTMESSTMESPTMESPLLSRSCRPPLFMTPPTNSLSKFVPKWVSKSGSFHENVSPPCTRLVSGLVHLLKFGRLRSCWVTILLPIMFLPCL